jgi:hypothetical protein
MKNEGFKTFTATMIALVTIVSATAAWRAAIASSEASQADFNGLAAAINAEEQHVLNSISVYEHYQAFLIYTRYNELGYRLADEIDAATNPDDSGLAPLEQLKSDSWGIAYGLQSLFFPSRYLRLDGTYDLQREMDEMTADSERQQDVKPALHFEKADALRLKSNLLISMLIFLGIALWMFTCAQIIERGIRYIFASAGVLLLGASVVGISLIELFL